MTDASLSSVLIKKRLISGGVWALSGKVATLVLGFAFNALLTRLLAPEQVGAYFLSISLASIASTVALLGLDQAVVRLVAESLGMENPSRSRAAVNIVFRYGTLGAVITAGILSLGVGRELAFRLFDSELMADSINLVAGWVIILTLQKLLAETFRGFHDIRLATVFSGLAQKILGVVLFTLLWLMYGHSSLGQILKWSLISGVVSVVLGMILLRHKVLTLERQKGQLRSKEVISIALPLLITSLAFVARYQATTWILGVFRPHEEVALYGAATRLASLMKTSLSLVNAVVPPLIAELYVQDNKKKLERILRTSALLAGGPALFGLILFILAGGSILGWVYGDYYHQGGTVLAIISIGNLVGVWAGPCQLTLIMTEYQVTVMVGTVISGALSVFLGLALVGEYGVEGLAIAQTISLTLLNLAMWLAVRLKVGIWTHMGYAGYVLEQVKKEWCERLN